MLDARGGRDIRFVNSARGQILARTEKRGSTQTSEQHYYYIQGKGVGEVSDSGPGYKDYTLEMKENYTAYQRSNSQSHAVQEDNKLVNLKSIFHADFDQNYRPIDAEYPAKTPGSYTVMGGETLQDVANSVFGDSSLWYLIAQENGLNGSETLAVGLELKIPNVVTNIHNNSSTFRPYDPGRAIGDVSATLPDAPMAKVPDAGGCSGALMIIMVIIVVIVCIFTAGAALGAFATMAGTTAGATVAATATAMTTALTATMGATMAAVVTAGAVVAAAAIGAAVGSIAGQLFGMATGLQDHFSWSQVGHSAVVGGLTAGIGYGIGQMANTAGTTMNSVMSNAYGNAIVSNVVSQGVNMALGDQHSFDWRGVATATVATGITQGIGAATSDDHAADYMKGSKGYNYTVGGDSFGGAGNATNGAVTGLASGVISQGVASAIYGHRFDWAGVASSTVQGATYGALEVQAWDPFSFGYKAGAASANNGNVTSKTQTTNNDGKAMSDKAQTKEVDGSDSQQKADANEQAATQFDDMNSKDHYYMASNDNGNDTMSTDTRMYDKFGRSSSRYVEATPENDVGNNTVGPTGTVGGDATSGGIQFDPTAIDTSNWDLEQYFGNTENTYPQQTIEAIGPLEGFTISNPIGQGLKGAYDFVTGIPHGVENLAVQAGLTVKDTIGHGFYDLANYVTGNHVQYDSESALYQSIDNKGALVTSLNMVGGTVHGLMAPLQAYADRDPYALGYNAAGIAFGATAGRVFGAASKTELNLSPWMSGDEVVPYTEKMAGTAPVTNPGFPSIGRVDNCVNCAIATDRTFAGHPTSALPYFDPKGVPISEIPKALGIEGSFAKVNTLDDLTTTFGEFGSGSRGVVYGDRGPGRVGHVFNVVVDQRGAVKYWDGQSMSVPTIQGQGYKNFRWIRSDK